MWSVTALALSKFGRWGRHRSELASLVVKLFWLLQINEYRELWPALVNRRMKTPCKLLLKLISAPTQ